MITLLKGLSQKGNKVIKGDWSISEIFLSNSVLTKVKNLLFCFRSQTWFQFLFPFHEVFFCIRKLDDLKNSFTIAKIKITNTLFGY